MSFYMYILRCSDNSYYIGHTENLEIRISEHNQRKVNGYTATRLPVQLVYAAEFGSRDEAFAAERQVKGWSRKKKEALMTEDWDRVQKLAKSRNLYVK